MTTNPMDCNELVELVTAYLDGKPRSGGPGAL